MEDYEEQPIQMCMYEDSHVYEDPCEEGDDDMLF